MLPFSIIPQRTAAIINICDGNISDLNRRDALGSIFSFFRNYIFRTLPLPEEWLFILLGLPL